MGLAQVPDGWMFGSGNAEGGKGFSGGMRRALAWCARAPPCECPFPPHTAAVFALSVSTAHTPASRGCLSARGRPRRYPQAGGADTNVTVLVTNVGADYTKLGSFGSAQDFGQNLVVSMDRTYLLRRRKNVGPVQVRRQDPRVDRRAQLPDAYQRVLHVGHSIPGVISQCKQALLSIKGGPFAARPREGGPSRHGSLSTYFRQVWSAPAVDRLRWSLISIAVLADGWCSRRRAARQAAGRARARPQVPAGVHRAEAGGGRAAPLPVGRLARLQRQARPLVVRLCCTAGALLAAWLRCAGLSGHPIVLGFGVTTRLHQQETSKRLWFSR